MAVSLSALFAGPGRFLILISVRGQVDPRAIVRLEGLGKLKNPVSSSRYNKCREINSDRRRQKEVVAVSVMQEGVTFSVNQPMWSNC
jgi:hypothetical protein